MRLYRYLFPITILFISPLLLNGQLNFLELPDQPFEFLEDGDMRLVDLNNDGFDDVYYSGIKDSVLYFRLYNNAQTGKFYQISNNVFGGFNPQKVKIADVNGDDLPDFIVTKTVGLDYENRLYLNMGNLKFQWKQNSILSTINYPVIGANDIDSDGDIDLLVIGNSNTLLINDGLGNFSSKNITGLAHIGWAAADFGDLDSDGDIDIFMTGARYNSSGTLDFSNKVFLNDGNFNFTHKPSILYDIMDSHLMIHDFNNDGFNDVYMTGVDGFLNGQFHRYTNISINDGTADFTMSPWFYNYDNASGGIGVKNDPAQCFADFNQDGYLDALTRDGIILNDGLSFSAPLPYLDIKWGQSCGDLDGDGDVDIITVYGPTQSVFIYRNELITDIYETSKNQERLWVNGHKIYSELNNVEMFIQVYTLTGSLVYSKSNINFPISLPDSLKKGVYIISIQSSQGTSHQKVMIGTM